MLATLDTVRIIGLTGGIAAGKTSSSDMNAFIGSYSAQGVTKNVKFDAKGEPSEVSVWAYKVSGGKIVPDQEIK